MSYPYSPYYYPYPQQQISQPVSQNGQLQQLQQPYQQQVSQQQTYQQSQQNIPIQNGGFAVVRSEQEARDYLLAPGTFMTFKDENLQYMYEKSRTFSQLDAPVFKKFRLVEEEDTPVEIITDPPVIDSKFALQEDLKQLTEEVSQLKEDIKSLRECPDKECDTETTSVKRVGRPRKEAF